MNDEKPTKRKVGSHSQVPKSQRPKPRKPKRESSLAADLDTIIGVPVTKESSRLTDEQLLAGRDDDIVRRATLWATGATIHDVKQLIGMYNIAISVLDRTVDRRSEAYTRIQEPGYYRFILELMNAATNQLAYFMNTGDYRRAGELFPFPKHPRTLATVESE